MIQEKKYVKDGTRKMVSPTCFKNVARTYARVPYSILELMIVHFKSVRLEKISMTLDNLVEMMSLTCFEKFVVGTQAWLPYSFPN